MKDLHLVNVLYRNDNASYQEFSLFLTELLRPANVVSQITPRQQVHNQVKIIPVVEGVVHVSYKLVPQLF